MKTLVMKQIFSFTFGSDVGRSVSEDETYLCIVDILSTKKKDSY